VPMSTGLMKRGGRGPISAIPGRAPGRQILRIACSLQRIPFQ
jgi:hypothetical protein